LADSSKAESRTRWRGPDTAVVCPAPSISISVPTSANRTSLTRASLSPAAAVPELGIPGRSYAGGTQLQPEWHSAATRMARRATMLVNGNLAGRKEVTS
jgi:hypothetical protein